MELFWLGVWSGGAGGAGAGGAKARGCWSGTSQQACQGRRVLRVTVMNPRTDVSHLAALVDGLTAEAALVLRAR